MFINVSVLSTIHHYSLGHIFSGHILKVYPLIMATNGVTAASRVGPTLGTWPSAECGTLHSADLGESWEMGVISMDRTIEFYVVVLYGVYMVLHI